MKSFKKRNKNPERNHRQNKHIQSWNVGEKSPAQSKQDIAYQNTEESGMLGTEDAQLLIN